MQPFEVGAQADEPFDGEVELGEFHGSNVDVGDVHQIREQLALRAYQMDQAFELISSGLLELPALKHDLRFRYAEALGRHSRSISGEERMTVARARAESEVRDALLRVEECQAQVDRGKAMLRALEAQLSSAQTRARLWEVQFGTELRLRTKI